MSVGSSDYRQARSSLGYYQPFQYQEVSFPVPNNKEDLHTLNLHQSYDYATNESPRIRCRSNFYKKWSRRLDDSFGFKKVHGMCTALADTPTPKRYAKGQLEALRNNKILYNLSSTQRPNIIKNQPPTEIKLSKTMNRYSKYKRKSLNNKNVVKEEMKKFEEKLPSLQGGGREQYHISNKNFLFI